MINDLRYLSRTFGILYVLKTTHFSDLLAQAPNLDWGK